MIPCLCWRPDGEAEFALDEWARKTRRRGDGDEERQIRTANRLRQLFAAFNIPFFPSPAQLVTKPHNVFIRGTHRLLLSAHDIVVRRWKRQQGMSLHE